MGARAVGSRAARTPGSTRRDLNLFTMLLSHTLSLPLVVEGIFIFRNIPVEVVNSFYFKRGFLKNYILSQDSYV